MESSTLIDLDKSIKRFDISQTSNTLKPLTLYFTEILYKFASEEKQWKKIKNHSILLSKL